MLREKNASLISLSEACIGEITCKTILKGYLCIKMHSLIRMPTCLYLLMCKPTATTCGFVEHKR